MNRLARYLFLGLCVVVLQTLLIPLIGIFNQRPDLVVVFALILGAFEGPAIGSLAGFLVGLAVDLYHPPTLGAGAMAGTVVGYLGGKVQVFLDLDHSLNQLTAFTVGHLVHNAFYLSVAAIQGEADLFGLFFGKGLGGAVYTAIVGTSVLTLVGAIRGRKHVVDRR